MLDLFFLRCEDHLRFYQTSLIESQCLLKSTLCLGFIKRHDGYGTVTLKFSSYMKLI
jgi:hypothetical protein